MRNLVTKLPESCLKEAFDPCLPGLVFRLHSSRSCEEKETILIADRQTHRAMDSCFTELGSVTVGRSLGDRTRVTGKTRTMKLILVPLAKHAGNGQLSRRRELTLNS